MILLDFYPSQYNFTSHYSSVFGATHSAFPDIPIYDTAFIPELHVTEVDVNTSLISIHAAPGRTISTECPVHPSHIRSTSLQTIRVLSSPARQFQQFAGFSRIAIFIRQGALIDVYGSVWTLEFAVFGDSQVKLFYRMKTDPAPLLLVIRQRLREEYRHMEGQYQVVDPEEDSGLHRI
jgi:hypothetical protein